MKLSKSTIEILNNFRNINPGLIVDPGNVLKTVSPSKTVFAMAVVEDTFEKPFAIYDLSQLLSALAVFEQPELIFSDKFLTIKENKQSAKIVFAERTMIVAPPNKEISVPFDVELDLDPKLLKKLVKSTSFFQLPEVAIVGDGTTISIRSTNSKDVTTNFFAIDLALSDKTFNLIIKADNFSKLLDDRQYKIAVSFRGIVKFFSADLTYFIPAEQNSSYE